MANRGWAGVLLLSLGMFTLYNDLTVSDAERWERLRVSVQHGRSDDIIAQNYTSASSGSDLPMTIVVIVMGLFWIMWAVKIGQERQKQAVEKSASPAVKN